MKFVDLNKTVSKLTKDERIYVGSYIGGIAASDEEKLASFEKIKNAVKSNKEGVFTRVDVEDFSIAYPDSMMFFNDYYSSILELCSEEEKQNIIYEKRFTLLIFAPIIFRDNDLDKLKDYAVSFSVTGGELAVAKKQFESLKFEYSTYDSSDVYSMSSLVSKIENDILFDEKTKYDIYDDYGIDNSRLKQCIVLSEYKDKLNEMLLENSFGYYDKLSELFEIIPTCLREGINFNDQNIKFNMLDFAYLTKEEPQQFIDYYKLTEEAHGDKQMMALLSNFARNNKYLGMNVNSKMIAQDFKLRFIINDVETVIDQDKADYIIGIFEQYNIPKKEYLVQMAARRYAAGLPILPLEELRKEKGKVLSYIKDEINE